jgi:hypothetical protein
MFAGKPDGSDALIPLARTIMPNTRCRNNFEIMPITYRMRSSN